MTLWKLEIAVASADGVGESDRVLVPEVAAAVCDDVPPGPGKRIGCQSRNDPAMFPHVVRGRDRTGRTGGQGRTAGQSTLSAGWRILWLRGPSLHGVLLTRWLGIDRVCRCFSPQSAPSPLSASLPRSRDADEILTEKSPILISDCEDLSGSTTQVVATMSAMNSHRVHSVRTLTGVLPRLPGADCRGRPIQQFQVTFQWHGQESLITATLLRFTRAGTARIE
ncbi:hypothetical protein CA85_21740 [Allorhodopirellula solitaria]|uniref:Uncharacterized protein n=1 Tax=Allorhodopirellula solitaria TaxID=2527987 RepID=A0A5C5XWM2_9BACT|nr:hypothetical protein CA85_21740 [Allorhodopirellula solitaria]